MPKKESKKNPLAGDQRRHELIIATINAISDYGLSKTTISKVAKTANLSQGIVNFYFDSKDQLLLETLKYISDEYNQAMEKALCISDDPLEILKAVISNSFDPKLCTPGKVVVWYAFWSESKARSDYLKICGDADRTFRDKLIVLFKSLLHQNDLPPSNAEALTRSFEGLIDVYWQEHLVDQKTFKHQKAIDSCNNYLDVLFPNQRKPKPNTKNTQPKKQKTTSQLAPWTYHNEEFFELEKQQIFKKNWLLVGHISDIPKTGDYLTFDAVGERALIVRTQDKSIMAFHNVCRHRGAKIVEDTQGNCPRAFVCPFHGWSYHLDGNNRHIPREETFTNVTKQNSSLIKLPIELWMGFIFICFSEIPESLEKIMAPVAEKFIPYQLENIQPLPNTKYRQLRPYNWKIIHDIDNEGYHVPIGHPSLQQLYGNNYQDTIEQDIPLSYGYIDDKPAKLWSVRHYQKLLPKFNHLPEENQRLWLYTGIFPSMVIGFYPDMIEFYMSVPATATSSYYMGGAYALPDNRREVKLSRYLTQRINQSTDAEDESFVSTIQQGIQSSAFPELKLSSLEHGVKHLHNKIQHFLPVATLSDAPESGSLARINEDMTMI